MRSKLLLLLVAIGLIGALTSAYQSSRPPHVQPPEVTPSQNPFERGIYANGIVEAYQEHGQNTNIYPEVTGVVTRISVSEGQTVHAGDSMLQLDDSVPRANAEQLAAQARAARAVLDELRAQPRKENLEVVAAQVEVAAANLATAQSQLDKQQRSYDIDPQSVSKLALDDARHAVATARANLDVAKRQHELTRAGAWVYDIRNQQNQTEALEKAAASAEATLRKYTLKAPRDGAILSVNAAVGSYVSSQGVYNSYTQLYDPIIVMGENSTLAVRAYVDEILVPRLPDSAHLTARMFIRGTNTSVPLQFVRVQPYVTPKIQLSNERTERVDLRVLPVVFRFAPPPGVTIYPGQLVDVYLATSTAPPPATARRNGAP